MSNENEIRVVVDEVVDIPFVEGLEKPWNNACASPFEIPLDAYTMKPWNNRNVNLSQWFNYGLNPHTWTTYAHRQMAIYKKSKQNRNKI